MSGNRPMVSVVLVNYRGAADTITCLESLRSLEWPSSSLEVIVVDNASGDDSVERILEAAPGVTMLALDENTGFAGGCNHGAAAATGDYLAFINNDARPDPQWLSEAVRVLEGDSSVGCVASRVLDWEGQVVDFVDSAMAFYGHGFKLHVGEPDPGAADREHDVLFASGAAMVMPTTVFREAGGFDARYFMFFEDVDLGWRLWVLGYEVRYVPSSLVFHRHHASMTDVASWREHYLLERNALFTIYKNYDDQNLDKVLPGAIALAVRRGIVLGGDDPHSLDLARSNEDEDALVPVHKQTLAAAYAVDAFVEELPGLAASRADLQSKRRRPDSDITRLFHLPLQQNIDDPYFRAGFDGVVEAFDLEKRFGTGHRILVATGDSLRPAMAGPAIRAWQIAQALSAEHEVELVSTTECADLDPADFRVSFAGRTEMRDLLDWCDVVVFQGYLMHEHPYLAKTKKVVVADIYDPFHLEQLEQARDLDWAGRRRVVSDATGVLNQQLTRGDFFTCASPKQRDFWLGQLAAVGRINPINYDADASLHSLVSVVPFGVSDRPPEHTRSVLKGVVPGIGEHDKVVLWGGGVYNWFDPLTLLRAVDKLRARVPEVRLFFLGMKHPNPNVPEMGMGAATRALSEELGLTGSHVFFNDGWVDYEDRQNYLLESDVGVSTHLDHVETEFSFRTRILDYFWAKLPVVATTGDSLADLIEEHDVGITVAPNDVDALEDALYTLLADDKRNAQCRENIANFVDDFTWSRTLEPLIQFCRNPTRAPDLVHPGVTGSTGITPWPELPRRLPGRAALRRALGHARRGEWSTLGTKATGRIKNLWSL